MSSESLSSVEGPEDQQTLLRGDFKENMEARAEHQTAKRYQLLYGGTTGLSVVLGILILIWTWKFRDGFGWKDAALEFNWHPVLMVFGLIILYSQAMLIYRTGRQIKKKVLKLSHAAMQAVAFICAVLALKAAFDSHNYALPPRPNLYTLHSWIGLLTVILFAYQFAMGFVTFLFPGLSKNLRSVILPLHVNFGTAIFTLVIVTAMMGLTEKAIWTVKDYEQYGSEGILVNFIGLIVVCYGALVLYLVNDAQYKRTTLPEDEIGLANTG